MLVFPYKHVLSYSSGLTLKQDGDILEELTNSQEHINFYRITKKGSHSNIPVCIQCVLGSISCHIRQTAKSPIKKAN